jgi:hypothetical protein
MTMSKSAQTVDEFCVDNHICRATFYNLKKRGRGPRIMKVGSRTLITTEASADWRREMEAETADRTGSAG